ncbi:hypothetical protein ACWGE0_24835 [Lentzea sp. NPDC054927]
MKMVKLSALAAVAATAALLASTTPSLAQGQSSPSAITPEVKALMTTQDKLHKIADRFERGNGFGGLFVDAGSKTLNVYWKGKAPAKVTAAAAVAKAQGLTVKVHSARYSQAELKAEASRIVKSNPAIQSIAAKYDGSGLAVKQAATGFSAKSAVPSSVAVEVETGAVELAASRLVDSSPYKGGAYIVNRRDGVAQGSCSSGYTVVDNATGADKLLTAAHCGALGTSYTNGAGEPVGQITSRSVASDSEIISLVGTGTGQARVWIGDSIQTESNQYGLDVIGSSATIAGDWLCDSGSYSGTICDIRAMNVGLTVCLTNFGCVNNSVEALHQGGYSAGGNGDSGGPIFSVQQPGDKLVARGTLTAISVAAADLRQCSGVPAGNGRQCSQRIIFPDVTAQMADHNFRIKTIA